MKRKLNIYITIISFILLSIINFTACSKVQYIAEYDKTTEDHIYKCALLVDEFFEEMLLIDEKNREFENFKNGYKNIEIELYKLIMLEQIRIKNEDSIKQANLLYEMWNDAMLKHEEDIIIKDIILYENRKIFIETFIELAKCEQNKKERSQD